MKLIPGIHKPQTQDNFDEITNDTFKSYIMPSYCETAKHRKKKNPKSTK